MIIEIHDDFNLKKISNSGQCFRCKEFGETYRFVTKEHVLYIKQVSDFSYDVSCDINEWNEIWFSYFDFDKNYSDIRKTIKKDRFMEAASDVGAGIRILNQDPWEMLISFIISQRKNIPAIKKTIESLAESYGEIVKTNHEKLYLFPTPEALLEATDTKLAESGLGYRLPYVKDAALRTYNGTALLKSWDLLDDEALLSNLKTVKGVGDKVANCIMLFSYKRSSCAPVDTWINKVITTYYNGENPFLKYKENAGIMQQYAFYYIKNQGNL